MQAPTEEFVDLRWIGQLGRSRISEDWNVRCFKSFAGYGSCQQDGGTGDCVFTWNRHIDYRPAGSPDIGRMLFLDEGREILQEDGVIPGDDYREIWKRLSECTEKSFGGRCFLPQTPGASGFFVACGKYVGVAVRIAETYSGFEGLSLAKIFDECERSPSASEQDALDNYFGAISLDGVVICCSRPIWIGKSIHSTLNSCMPQCNASPHPLPSPIYPPFGRALSSASL